MNMDEKQAKFVVKDKDGNEVECEMLFTFDSKETGKSYMVYTDHTLDEAGNKKAYASTYNPNDPTGKLEPVQSEKEWKIIEAIFTSIEEQAKAQAQAMAQNGGAENGNENI